MPQTDELAETVVAVTVGLVLAHLRGDRDGIAAELGKLLSATAKYAAGERAGQDEALVRAVALL